MKPLPGGSGATAKKAGVHGIHTHMTNTRITDPEVIESQFPLRIKEFSIKKGSGGKGKHRGGNGLLRRYEFLKNLQVSIISQRRTYPPYGLKGGMPGKTGKNMRILSSGKKLVLGGNATYRATAGEQLIIITPGGGGWGKP